MSHFSRGAQVALALCLFGVVAVSPAQAQSDCTSTTTFDDGTLQGYTVQPVTNGTLWHVSNTCGAQSGAHSTPFALYYGIDGACNFDTGTANASNAISPPILVAGGQNELRFNSLRDAELGFDVTEVAFSTDGGGSWSTFLTSANLPNDGAWHSITAQLPAAASATGTLQLRFLFNSTDDIDNDTIGWMVDDIRICRGAPPASVPATNEGMLALMTAALAVLGIAVLRQRRRSRTR